jgi:hypothetical protein
VDVHRSIRRPASVIRSSRICSSAAFNASFAVGVISAFVVADNAIAQSNIEMEPWQRPAPESAASGDKLTG